MSRVFALSMHRVSRRLCAVVTLVLAIPYSEDDNFLRGGLGGVPCPCPSLFLEATLLEARTLGANLGTSSMLVDWLGENSYTHKEPRPGGTGHLEAGPSRNPGPFAHHIFASAFSHMPSAVA